MTLSLAASSTERPTYRCPGERYSIDHATHLGRLANFYSKCHACPHRDDTATLSKNIVKRLGETQRRATVPISFTGEILQGDVGRDLTADLARSTARWFGIWLHNKASHGDAPRVIVAGDGRPLTAPLVAAVSEGLTWSGCCVIDVGRVIVPAAIDAQTELQADATVTVGNAPGHPQTASIRFFASQGRSVLIDELAPIHAPLSSIPARPTRHAPPALRATVHQSYLDRLRQYFHALRPLKFVLDTPSPTVIEWTAELLDQVACSAILLRGARRYVGEHALEAPGTIQDQPTGVKRHQPRDVVRAVKEEAAHFGASIDGDGHALNVWDETGRKLHPEELFCVIATLGQLDSAGKRVVVTYDSQTGIVEALRLRGFEVLLVSAETPDMTTAMLTHDATLGLGPDGRIWHRNHVPMVDAMQSLAALLVALSQSDRPLSAIADQK